MELITQQQLKALESGAFCNDYLIYNRKSTDEPDNQKNSIAFQKQAIFEFAASESLPIAKWTARNFCTDGFVVEKRSAFKESNTLLFNNSGTVQYEIFRPKFHLLADLLSKRYFKGVICLCYDRLSRNKSDNSLVDKLINAGVDIRFVWTTSELNSSGAIHRDIDGIVSQHHSRVTSEKVRETTRSLRDDGICTYKAGVGYLNEGNMDWKPFDPDRAPILKEAFERRATGEWSYSALSRWATHEHGFTMPAVRRPRTLEERLADESDDVPEIPKVERPITPTGMKKILSNDFYAGFIKGSQGQRVVSKSHQALISLELFEKVQAVGKKRNTSVHYEKSLPLPYRKFVRCHQCKRAYTPYTQKSMVYYGARCSQSCSNKLRSFSMPQLEEKIGEAIRHIPYTQEDLDEMEKRCSEHIILAEENRQAELKVVERKKRKIREDQTYLFDNKIDLLRSGAYSAKDFVKALETLDRKLKKLQYVEQISDDSMRETVSQVVINAELLQDAWLSYMSANSEEKEKTARIIFVELYVDENTLKYQTQIGFRVFETPFSAVCDPTGWIVELFEQLQDMKSSAEKLKGFFSQQSH